jgi:hypothetical protein
VPASLGAPGARQVRHRGTTLVWISADGQAWEQLDGGLVLHRGELDALGNWPLFDSGWVFHASPTPIGEREVAGRLGIVVEAHDAAGFLLPGANRCVAVVDCERGIVLAAEAWLDDELLMIEELIEVIFDEPLPERPPSPL